MNIRTDLALESMDTVTGSLPKGVVSDQKTQGNTNVSTVKVTDENAAKAMGKPIGDYITIEPQSLKDATTEFEDEVSLVAEHLRMLLPRDLSSVLVVGLGNRDITPDALGPNAIRYILATRHISPELAREIGLEGLTPVSAVATGVLGQTGLETAEIVGAICKQTHPTAVIVIDALACKSLDRLGKTIQMSNTGICPGSGVQNARKELNQKTLNTTVVSIGVPMVVDLRTIVSQITGNEPYLQSNMMVTPREIDTMIEHSAKIIAYSINKCLQPSLDIETITALVD